MCEESYILKDLELIPGSYYRILIYYLSYFVYYIVWVGVIFNVEIHDLTLLGAMYRDCFTEI